MLYLILFEKLNALNCSSNEHHDADITVKVKPSESNGLNACVIILSSPHVGDDFDPSEADHVVILLQPKFIKFVALQEDDFYIMSLRVQIIGLESQSFFQLIVYPQYEICIEMFRIWHLYEPNFFVSFDLLYIFHIVFRIGKDDIVVVVVESIVDAYVLRSQMLNLINVASLHFDVLWSIREGRSKCLKTDDLIYFELIFILLFLDFFYQVYCSAVSRVVELLYPREHKGHQDDLWLVQRV